MIFYAKYDIIYGVQKKGQKVIMFKIGDYAKLTKRLQYKFGVSLGIGKIVKIDSNLENGIYKCIIDKTSPIRYSIAPNELEPCEKNEESLWYYVEKASIRQSYTLYTNENGFLHNNKGEVEFVNKIEYASTYSKSIAHIIADIISKKYKVNVHILKQIKMFEDKCEKIENNQKEM